MRAYVEACLPAEACGLLAGLDGVVHEILPITNEAHSAVRFRMAPAEQVKAFNRIENSGLELIGIFHSHPAGPEDPSPTDLAEASYEVTQIIWSRTGEIWSVRGFSIRNGSASEVKLYVSDGKSQSTKPD